MAGGISEQVASQIYDDMMDFAKYAFNKSHAACYAVVSYQTAYLKYYYPVEFMAALMTSVIDNPGKVAEYIMVCRNMGIAILPPDINKGEGQFSVDGKSIRYALTAIKSVGRPVIEAVVGERNERGLYTNLKDFITRMADKEVNKKAIENFIKAGAFDSLPGTRKQFMSAYVQIMERIIHDRKNNMAGQISLFDIVDESQKEEFEVKLPDVGEYSKEMLLAFEEKLLLRTIGEVMGNKSGKLSTALLHNARYTMQRFAGRVIKVFLKGDNPTLKEENLLSYDQFQKVFEERKRVASLLFDTGEGYFACCILTPDQISESPGIPISQENALDEVAHYLKERQELEAQPPKKKVLVVDDSATMRQGLKNLLGWDYEVSTVDNGLAAIRTVTLNRPDLILLDYDMPTCNGKQTLELLRSETHSEDIPVIFLTARDDADSVKGVLSLKPSGYLLKTLGHAEIKARVDGFFEKNP